MKSTFAEHNKKYAAFAEKSFSWLYIEQPALNMYLKPLLGRTVKIIDAGCGLGRYIPYYLGNGALQKNITAIEPDDHLLTLARQRFSEIKYLQASLTKTQSLKKQDLIIVSFVLHLMNDKELKTTLHNFYKWLKPGGRIFFIGNHPIRLVREDLSTYYQRGWHRYPTPWGKMLNEYHRTVSDHINAFISAGFQIEIVAEPRPVIKGVKKDKKQYVEYCATPTRLMIIAKKI